MRFSIFGLDSPPICRKPDPIQGLSIPQKVYIELDGVVQSGRFHGVANELRQLIGCGLRPEDSVGGRIGMTEVRLGLGSTAIVEDFYRCLYLRFKNISLMSPARLEARMDSLLPFL